MDNRNLHILWTTGDPLTAEKMVLMYATNSMLHGWWQSVTVILWGASVVLAARDERVRDKMALARQAGVTFTACKACTDQCAVTQALAAQGVTPESWGVKLTDLLSSGGPMITV